MTPHFVQERLAALRAAKLLREPPTLVTDDGVHGRVDGRPAILFCGNDYLGLRMHPEVRRAAARAAEEEGGGSGSSRLIAGSLPGHAALEEEIADWMGTGAALVCSSGYQANLALLGALAGRGDRIDSDALNHASIIDGCRLSRAEVVRLPHGDGAALCPGGDVDEGTRRPAPPRQRFLVGEGLFSMDGDRGPVRAWAAAAHRWGAHLLVDEAHAVGVLGPQGRGVCAEAGVPNAPLARVGTFGKAFGAHGAFIATDSDTRSLVVNAGRAYVFSTALPPAAVGAARAALALVRSDEGAERRARVLQRAQRFADGARALGLDLGALDPAAATPIVPVVLGAPDRALAVAARLLDAGIYARAIRPPTVPIGSSRIRFTLSADHRIEDVDAALAALESALR